MNREGDIVLLYYQDKPAAYARIEAIEPDKKKVWYQVTLLLLTIPAQIVTWILREEYINGAIFSMGGQSMRLEEVPREHLEEESDVSTQRSGQKGKGKGAKVISFTKKDPDHLP
ncbi:MAG: hypothetical protein JSW15_07945 [Deltaproteobacteria bacterium]|nr:MAG: hypothetical protein JSW15_07945 [Deltaproteobacteria bacterium]